MDNEQLISQLKQIQKLINTKVSLANTDELTKNFASGTYAPETVAGISMSTCKENTDIIHVALVTYNPRDGGFYYDRVRRFNVADDKYRNCPETQKFIAKHFPEEVDKLFPLALPDKTEQGENGFPYMPGFLAFREVEIFYDIYKEMLDTGVDPEIIVVDGNGYLHPRMAGLGCHFGVLIDKPVIGVSKDFLPCGEWDRERIRGMTDKLEEYGDYFEIKTDETVYGVAWRTPTSKAPIFISVGHNIDVKTSIEIISSMAFTRVPEPINTSRTLAKKKRMSYERGLSKKNVHEATNTEETNAEIVVNNSVTNSN
jgi:deoxyribonuclease V